MNTNFSWPNGKRAALSLSFDDASLSQVDAGIPILDATGVRGTFYVSPANVEQRVDAPTGEHDGHINFTVSLRFSAKVFHLD